jgi:hypothetical protein
MNGESATAKCRDYKIKNSESPFRDLGYEFNNGT